MSDGSSFDKFKVRNYFQGIKHTFFSSSIKALPEAPFINICLTPENWPATINVGSRDASNFFPLPQRIKQWGEEEQAVKE